MRPDNWHLVWIGIGEHSDLRLATAFLRKYLRFLLGAAVLQDRAHDHLLRDHEREHDAFPSTCSYVLQNPERARWREDWRSWPHLGAVVNGYPDRDPRADDFWGKFWCIHHRLDDPCVHAQRFEKQSTS